MSAPGKIKVLQFNMQFGQLWRDDDPDGAPVDLAATVAEIKSHDADVILLQEVEMACQGGTHPPVPPHYTRLQHELAGYESVFSFPREDPRELPFGIGLAIFARSPLRDLVTVNLPSPRVEFNFNGETRTPTDRLLIGVTTTIAGREVRLLNTHLLAFFMLNSSSEEHGEQREIVAAELRKSTGPTILGGDFNVREHESLIRQMGEAGFRTAQSAEITWRRRPYVLDHIFYNDWFRLVACAVKPTPASDHHALSAVLEFAK